MRVDIFDVDHGQCSLITADNGSRALIDCGHSYQKGWYPSQYLDSLGIIYLEKLVITNADEDHASDLHRLLPRVSIGTLLRNPSLRGTDLFVKHGDLTILYPGDLERVGWLKLLARPEFRTEVGKVDVLIASHHGRESGCCAELYDWTGWRPRFTVISDAGKQYASQETQAWYRERTRGGHFGGTERFVLSTRSDGHILFETTPGGFYARSA